MKRLKQIAELAITDLESYGVIFTDRLQAIKQATELLYDVVDNEDMSSAELLAHLYKFYKSETVVDIYNLIYILVDSKNITNKIFEEVLNEQVK